MTVHFAEINSFNSLGFYFGDHAEICSLLNLSFMKVILSLVRLEGTYNLKKNKKAK